MKKEILDFNPEMYLDEPDEKRVCEFCHQLKKTKRIFHKDTCLECQEEIPALVRKRWGHDPIWTLLACLVKYGSWKNLKKQFPNIWR